MKLCGHYGHQLKYSYTGVSDYTITMVCPVAPSILFIDQIYCTVCPVSTAQLYYSIDANYSTLTRESEEA